MIVLVPFRGNTFLNENYIYNYHENDDKFSSPFGEIHFLTLSLGTRYISGFPDRFAAQKQIVLSFMILISKKYRKTQHLSHARQKLQIEHQF